jgi:CBS domain-containing protein
LTGDYKIMLPLMISCIIATLLSSQLQSASIYTLKLLRRGVDIHKGQDISVLRHLGVRDEMRKDPVTVPPGETLMPVVSKLIEHPGTSIFVVDEQRKLLGVITADQSRSIIANASSFEAFIIAQDMMLETDFPVVSPDDTLADVMKRLARYRGEVPVVENGRLVGVIWPEDVLGRYDAELFKRDMASSMASTISRGPQTEPIPAVENISMAEVAVPAWFVGKSLGSLDIRNRYQVSVLLIKRRKGAREEMVGSVPDADYVFRTGDVMLVMGPDNKLRQLERGEPVNG